MVAELRTAATVLVLRDGDGGPEVFMVRRHERAMFMPGAYVFPGGAVDPADGDEALGDYCDGLEHAAGQVPGLDVGDARALHVAAIRELFEEAGILLARDQSGALVHLDQSASHERFARYRRDLHGGAQSLRAVLESEGLRLALDVLILHAHWVTPRFDTRRFDTRFFLTRLPAGQTPRQDDNETLDGRWTRATDMIAAARRREVLLPPPTWATLCELEPLRFVDAVLQRAREAHIRRREPSLVERAGERRLIVDQGDGDDSAVAIQFNWVGDRWEPGQGLIPA